MKASSLFLPAVLAAASSTTLHAQDDLWTSVGAQRDLVGRILRPAGDVDGDGVGDAMMHRGSHPLTSVVAVLSGVDGSLLREFTDPLPWWDGFGEALAGLGDVDGDGLSDVAIASTSSVPGIVRVYSGGNGDQLYEVVGKDDDVGFAWQLQALGDVDGDGFGDLGILVGYSTTLGAGVVEVRSGVDGSLVRTLVVNAAGAYSASLADAGDVDSDGVSDLVVGDHEASFTAQKAGRMTVFSGATGATLLTVDGPAAGAHFGTVVAGLGDVDGDGASDVAGALYGQGVLVYSGPTGAVLYFADEGRIASRLTGTGDCDGDGWPDFVASNTSDDTNGERSGRVSLYSGRDGTLLYTRLGEKENREFGAQLAALGDLDGDGLADFLVGEPGYAPQQKGRILALSGAVHVGLSYCGPAVPNSTGVPAEIRAFGSDLVSDGVLHLSAIGMPVHRTGMFLTSETQGFSTPPGSQGNLCLGGTIGRYVHQAQTSDAAGSFGLQVDLEDMPPPAQQVVLPGETWNFQAWFRDANPTKTSNFTDAVAVTFS